MADDAHNSSDISDASTAASVREDAETTAARRELKQTSISERGGLESSHDHTTNISLDDKTGCDEDIDADKTSEDETCQSNDIDAQEKVSSPKKKRAHDEVDQHKEAPAETESSAHISRTNRSEPEKKRPRDEQEVEDAKVPQHDEVETLSGSGRKGPGTSDDSDARTSTETLQGDQDGKPQDPVLCFATPGLGKLSSTSASPFGRLGAGKPGLFSSAGTEAQTSFTQMSATKPPAIAPAAAPRLKFGISTPSPFMTAANAQASALKGNFSVIAGDGVSGARLNSFGNPDRALASGKPAKPFGAPDSDAGDASDADEDGEDGEDSKSDNEDTNELAETKPPAEDKKKPKLQKVQVDDGEGVEVTLLAVRAKMFHFEKAAGGEGTGSWKERGGGMLKVNVPRASVELDKDGNFNPATFNASGLESTTDKRVGRNHVRLVMRQDSTLRVILNTVIFPTMAFQHNQGLRASYVMFTAIEDSEPKKVQMKMTEANATLLIQLTDTILQRLKAA